MNVYYLCIHVMSKVLEELHISSSAFSHLVCDMTECKKYVIKKVIIVFLFNVVIKHIFALFLCYVNGYVVSNKKICLFAMKLLMLYYH